MCFIDEPGLSITYKSSEFCQDVGHGGVGFIVLLRLREWPPCHVDKPRCDDGEHVELLARVGGQIRTRDKIMSDGRKHRGIIRRRAGRFLFFKT